MHQNAGWVMGLLALAGLAGAGCRQVVAVKTTTASANKVTGDDSLMQAGEVIKKAGGAGSYRQALQLINTHINRNSDARAKPLTDSQRAFLTEQVGLDAGELAEVDSLAFTSLDAHHLDLCYLLRDAARVCTTAEQTPMDRAAAAFAWIVRQIRLPVPEREQGNEAEPLPQQFVLRRGWGTPIERGFVFLALLQQLGIDGCMATLPSESEIAKYWIPAVLIDGEFYLFDTRLGLPLPGPDGQGVASLTQVRSHATPFAALQFDEQRRYDVKDAEVKAIALHLSYPISALAPRMKQLESLLKPNAARLSVDMQAAHERFQKAAQKAGVPVSVNNRPTALASHSPVRVLRRFLPPSEGGVNNLKDTQKTRDDVDLFPWAALQLSLRNPNTGQAYVVDLRQKPFANAELVLEVIKGFASLFVQFPLPAVAGGSDVTASRPDDLFRSKGEREQTGPAHDDTVQRFAMAMLGQDQAVSASSIVHYLLAPRSSRDDMLRGRFDEAVVKLTAVIDQVGAQKSLTRSTDDVEARMAQWLEEALQVQAQLNSARERNNPADVESIQRRVAELRVGRAAELLGNSRAQPLNVKAARLPIWIVWVLGRAAEPMGADASYWLALAKHEQAEKAQASAKTSSPEKIRDAWRTADSFWSQFLEDHPSSAMMHAARLGKARALAALGDPDGAAQQLQRSSIKLTPLEELALAFQVGQIRAH